jgi:hypothetical protein
MLDWWPDGWVGACCSQCKKTQYRCYDVFVGTYFGLKMKRFYMMVHWLVGWFARKISP